MLGILPTGGGKSLAYQLPSLVLPRMVVVVSPLIALMKDQREQLEAAHIEVIELDSTIGTRETRNSEQRIRNGSRALVYVTPERLQTEECIELLSANGVSLIAVDEAHCVSQWGHDFRPAYLRIAEVAERLGRPPIIALTATATPAVQADIIEQLGLRVQDVIRPRVERPNLGLYVHRTPSEPLRVELIVELLERCNGVGIVYCSTVKAVDDLHETLVHRVSGGVARYHAQLADGEREDERQRFMSGAARVVVATKAFGMGVNKKDVRAVVHAQLPDSIESYTQEAGRRGVMASLHVRISSIGSRTSGCSATSSRPRPRAARTS